MITRAKILTLIVSILLLFSSSSFATVYVYFDAESHPCDGSELPNPPFWTQNVNQRGHVTCGECPQGARFFEWQTVDRQDAHYTEVKGPNLFPVPLNLVTGRTYYLAYYFRFTRINGIDIWHVTGDSADKGVELYGSGLRWLISRGHWGNLANNQAHRYTVWGGNPTFQLNREITNYDIILPNRSGYSASNPIQLEYERWYSAVMALRIAMDKTGYYAFWIGGQKVTEHDNIKTVATSSATINQITMGGTIAQPAYDAPAHKRQFDALILTDDWQDIVNGGYMSGDAGPSAPAGLRIVTP